MNEDIRDAVRRGPMSRFQVGAVAICVALTMMDGFDVMVMAFASSAVANEWALSGQQLGLLLSAAPLGMTAGSFLLAPWADRFGRCSVVLASLVLCSAGMLASALARTPMELTVMRLLTGLGIGGMMVNLNVITVEYSSDRSRSIAVGLQATGYPLCAALGGAIATWVITHHGWRSVFGGGAVVSAAMIPMVLFYLPESLDFILERRPPNALEKVNALLRRMNRGAIDELPPPKPKSPSTPIRRLFMDGAARSSVTMALAFCLVTFATAFIQMWTPKLLSAAGFPAEQGMTAAVLLNAGGIASGATFGFLAARFGLSRVTALAMLAAATCLPLLGFAHGRAVAFPAALAIGAFDFAAMVGLYSLTPMLYPASIRATGMAWASGVGRFGAILSPAVAGFLVDSGWTRPMLYCGHALPLVVAALVTRSIISPPKAR